MKTSSWGRDGSPIPRFSPLERDRAADAVVIGAGITGLTWGTYAAERIASLILGQEESRDDRLFSPARLDLVGSVDRMARDQAEVMWRLIAERLRPGGDLHPGDLGPGEGRILTVDGRKVGVCRDESGELLAVSPSCRHMGCIVGWNALARTWDCPCHGGRYRADGTRIWGPPMGDLDRRKI